MIVHIFLYNVVYIKSDFSRLRRFKDQKLILIANEYCLTRLAKENREWFDAIHQLTKRDFHKIDHDTVEEIVLTYVKEYGAENIMLLTNEDSAQMTCAILREKYDIPGPSVEQVLPFVNKVVSKRRIGDAVRLPKFLLFDKEKYKNNPEAYLDFLIEEIGFPMLSKPIDLVSSVGVQSIFNMDTLKNVAESILHHEYEFEIDECIEGDLFYCDSLMIDGKLKFFSAGVCSTPLAAFMKGHSIRALQIGDDEVVAKLQSFCEKVYKKLNCNLGAYHMELFLEKRSKEFIFLEIGARTGGALISRVYQRTLSMSIEEVNYLIQMGLLKEINLKPSNVFSGFYIFPKIQGEVKAIKRPNIEGIEYEFIEYVKKGEFISQAENLLDMSCGLIFWDKSYKKVVDTFNALKSYNPLEVEELYKVPILLQNQTIFDALFKMMPFLFWKDLNGRYYGSNFNQASNLGFESPEEYIGCTIFEIVKDQETAILIDQNDRRIMKEGIIQIVEEKINDRTFLSQKGPIHDDSGNVIGMVGFSMEITELKKVEEELKKAQINEYKKAKEFADGIVHDIKSPLTSLLIVVETCENEMPEQIRTILSGIATNIQGIIGAIEGRYCHSSKKFEPLVSEAPVPAILSAILLQLLTEKKMQYKEWPVKFTYNFYQCSFSCIRVNLASFKCMLSNILDNAAESINHQHGNVSIIVKAHGEGHIQIIIQDNGHGMTKEVIEKILNDSRVSVNAEYGRGLGFVQILDALRLNDGQIAIDSKVDEGTEITLTFPVIKPSFVMREEIALNKGDTVVILDDEHDNHQMWSVRFKEYLDKIDVRHFTDTEEIMAFINNFPHKDKIFLLSDFELLGKKYKLNGLDIIEKTNIMRSILLVNNYIDFIKDDIFVQKRIAILPKLLASKIPITISANDK